MSKTGEKIKLAVLNNKTVSYMYFQGKLIWSAIRSCFGKGYWVDNKPWNNNDGWKNNY